MFILNKSTIYNTLLFLIVIFVPSHVSATHLIQNSEFETEKNGWDTTASTVNFSIVSDEIKEGTKSAKIIYSPTTLSHGIFQSTTSVVPDKKYRIVVYAKSTDLTKKVFLRLRWYQGTGYTDVDSTTLQDATDWIALEIISTAPSTVSKAEVRLHVSGGTGYFDNIIMEEYIEPSLSPTPSPSPTPVPTATPTTEPSQNYDNIYISEVMVAPNTGKDEWIEFYNDNDFEVNLADWYLDDIENEDSKPKKFSINIAAKTYKIVILSNGIFNNSGDVVRLLDQDENEKDFFEYTSSEKGKSWGWATVKGTAFCLQTPTQNNPNTNCTSSSQSSEESSQNSGSSSTNTNPIKKTTSQILGTSTSNSSLKSYAIAVTPPTIFKEGTVESEQSVLSATTSQTIPQASPGYLPLLAASYSLLSIGSLVAKMIYS